MSAQPSNVVAFAPYQARHAFEQRPPRPYLLWYPHVGFVKPSAALIPLSQQRLVRQPERA